MDSVDISGVSFLMMLSSEKSLAYWERLRIPVVRKRYSETMLFARAGLELVFYISVTKQRERYSFQELWKDYRATNGVLTDKFLEDNRLDYQNGFDGINLQKIFQFLKEDYDFAESNLIYEWYIKYFRDESDSIMESAERLGYLLDEFKNGNIFGLQQIEIIEPFFERVRKFHNHVKWRNDSLNKHFLVAYEVHEMTLPNEWEMVMQDIHSEDYKGYRSNYDWMRHVEQTLQYVNFYERWQELKESLGYENIKIILNWLEETLNKLPSRYWCLKDEDLKRLQKL